MALVGIAFSLVFAFACLMALVRHPIYGLMAYLAAFYIHPPSRWWGQGILLDVRWALIAAGVTLVGIAVHRRARVARPFFSFGVSWALLIFLAWIWVQSFWAAAPELQQELTTIYAKFIVAAYMIYRTVDSEKHLRWFLWAHVLGCFYLSWIAFTSYSSGRFEEFGGPGINEANAAANQLVTAILVAASLFIAGGFRQKVLATGVMPFLVNALVATASRSGFLAFCVGGLIFNLFTPRGIRGQVRVISVLGIVLLLMVSGTIYWQRVNTIAAGGQEIEGVDTGSGRLDIIRAQLNMARDFPLGCGHRCTGVYARDYIAEKHFKDMRDDQTRTSHNTFFTLLVEQGWPGAVFYLFLLVWTLWTLRRQKKLYPDDDGILGRVLPAVAGSLMAVFVGDMFVDYLKHEVRIWLIAILMAIVAMREAREKSVAPH